VARRAARGRWRRPLRRALLALAAAWLVATLGPIAALRVVPPVTTSFMVQRWLGHGAGGRCRSIEYDWVGWDAISPHAKLAVLASEDQRFAQHGGFDLKEIRNAVTERRSGARGRGASTITQQVAKNLFLWPAPSFVRKAVEAWLTLWIEALWPKRRILEVYLNVAQMGPCTFGVEAAARRFFGVPAARLSAGQAALLAAVLPDPARRRVEDPTPALRSRAARIERQMRALAPGALRALD
jgi:monofunctional biosynthetic peptidoglycan transglycosylase